MDISFQKLEGVSSLGIEFFWKLAIETGTPAAITDHFIPELYLDYFFLKQGSANCRDNARGTTFRLPRQVLKTIHIRPLTFVFSTPLVLFGVRLSLRFAEAFWEQAEANSFLEQEWVGHATGELEQFALQAVLHIQSHRVRKNPYTLLGEDMKETGWLAGFSPRHKRRLYRDTFGLSRKDLQNIRNVQSFLEQACDFAAENPRIIWHMDPEVFHDQPHLNHAFRKMTGYTPVEYFEANSILQDHLMSASYNAKTAARVRIRLTSHEEREYP